MLCCLCAFIKYAFVRSCMHNLPIPMRAVNFVNAYAHATAQRALDISAVLRKIKF